LLVVGAGFVFSGVVVVWTGWPLRTRVLAWPRALLGLSSAAALAVGSFIALLQLFGDAGLDPRAQAWAASVAAMLAYVGLHVVLMLIFTGYLVARAGAGLLTPRQRASHDNIVLLWGCGCAQAVLAALLPHAVVWGLA
jgi:cytochrome c oxidase subunit I+III